MSIALLGLATTIPADVLNRMNFLREMICRHVVESAEVDVGVIVLRAV